MWSIDEELNKAADKAAIFLLAVILTLIFGFVFSLLKIVGILLLSWTWLIAVIPASLILSVIIFTFLA